MKADKTIVLNILIKITLDGKDKMHIEMMDKQKSYYSGQHRQREASLELKNLILEELFSNDFECYLKRNIPNLCHLSNSLSLLSTMKSKVKQKKWIYEDYKEVIYSSVH